MLKTLLIEEQAIIYAFNTLFIHSASSKCYRYGRKKTPNILLGCKDAKYGLSNMTNTLEENKTGEGNKKCKEENNAILSRMTRDSLIAVIFEDLKE